MTKNHISAQRYSSPRLHQKHFTRPGITWIPKILKVDKHLRFFHTGMKISIQNKSFKKVLRCEEESRRKSRVEHNHKILLPHVLNGLAVDYLVPGQIVLDHAGNIMSMCLKVFGKANKDCITLILCMDNECPELCPVCLLMGYIYALKSKVVSFSFWIWS